MNIDPLLTRLLEGFYSSSHGKVWLDFRDTYLNEPLLFLDRFLNELSANSTVVDLGCGEAKYLSRLLAERTTNVSYWIGLDISLESLRKGVENAMVSKQKHKIDFILADINYLPFKEEAFDGILIQMVLHHLANFLSIGQLYQIAKKGCRLLVMDLPGVNPFRFVERKIARFVECSILGYGRTFYFFTPKRLRQTILEANFIIIKCDYEDFFVRRLLNLFLVIPPLRHIISWKTLMALYLLEKKFGQLPLLSELCACVVLYCIK